MKSDIHPEYNETTVSCACGKVMQVRSTAKDMRVNVCSSCHPFYSGSKQVSKHADSRVTRFKQRYGVKPTEPQK